MINADVLDVVEATVALGADPTKARSWWLGEISRIANEKDVAVKDLPIAASDVAEIVADGSLIELPKASANLMSTRASSVPSATDHRR